MEREGKKENNNNNKNKSTTFRSISGFALPSMHHNNSPLLLYFPIIEISATALRGTSGKFLNNRRFQMVLYTVSTYTKTFCSICQDDPQLSMPLFVLGSVGARSIWQHDFSNCCQVCRLMFTRFVPSSSETAGCDQFVPSSRLLQKFSPRRTPLLLSTP